MKSPGKFLLAIYAAAVLFDLLLILQQREDLRWFSKPLLMPVLMMFFFAQSQQRSGKPFYLILIALFFSFCGDVLLLAKNLFIPGLVSFLLAHVVYILYFNGASGNGKGLVARKPLLLLPVLLYIFALLLFLFPYLSQLKLPVIVYSLTIGTMLLMTINTHQRIDAAASISFIWGALLFVLSDSLLAVNLFVSENWLFGPFVMATYAAAQYLIVQGALLNANSFRRKGNGLKSQSQTNFIIVEKQKAN